MSSKFLRVFLSVAATAVFVAVSTTPARAAAYSPVFDPEFDGTALFTIGDACLTQADGTYPSTGDCQVNMIFASLFVDGIPSILYTSGEQDDIGFQVVIADHQLTEFSTLDPFVCHGDTCGDLEFLTQSQEGGTFCNSTCEAAATLTFGTTTLRDGYRLVAVPEPGTLGLLLAGIGAAWFRGRRKAAA